MTASSSVNKVLSGFNAVDLVTLAVFAALYRALWYVWHALNFFFPFNLSLNAFFFGLCALAAVVIVRKVGSIMLFVVAAMAVNVFIQGESFAVAAIYLTWGILAEIYIYIRLRSGADPFKSLRDMLIAACLMSLIWTITNWVIVIPYIFLVELTPTVWIAVSILSLILCVVGGWIGFLLGNKIKGLIG